MKPEKVFFNVEVVENPALTGQVRRDKRREIYKKTSASPLRSYRPLRLVFRGSLNSILNN